MFKPTMDQQTIKSIIETQAPDYTTRQDSRRPREPSNHVYYPGLQLEIRHKRATVQATVLDYISKTKIVVKVNETGEIRIIGTSNIRVHIEPPPGQPHVEPEITKEDAEKIKVLLDTKPKSANNPVGRPRIHPVGTDMSAVYRERYKFRRHQEEMKRRRQFAEKGLDKHGKQIVNAAGKKLIEEKSKVIKIKGKPHTCNVKIYSDGTQAIAIKKSELDPESRMLVTDLAERQQRGEDVMAAIDVPRFDVTTYKRRPEKKKMPDKLPEIPKPDPGNKNVPPCNFTVYKPQDKSEKAVYIKSQALLEPDVELIDCLHGFKKRFKLDAPEKITLSLDAMFGPNCFEKLDIDHKWAENLAVEFLPEDPDELNEMYGKEPQKESAPALEFSSILDDSDENIKQLKELLQTMSLDEITEVMLPVLVDKISPADILLEHSKSSTDSTRIDMAKMLNHLNKCKRNLSWIKNNTRNLDANINPNTQPDLPRRAILTVDEDDENTDQLIFDDENQIDINDANLEMKLVMDMVRMIGVGQEEKNKFETKGESSSKFYTENNFASFSLGKSPYAAENKISEQDTELIQQVANLVDLENEYDILEGEL